MSFTLPTPTTRAEKETFVFIGPKHYTQEGLSPAADYTPKFGENALTLEGQHGGSFTGIIPDNTSQTLVEVITGNQPSVLADTQAFTLGKGATLTHIRLHMGSDDYTLVRQVSAELAEEATYNQFTLTAGGKATRTETFVNLNGSGAHINVQGIALLDGTQRTDSFTNMQFKSPNCTANVEQRQILSDTSHACFQGKFHVHQIAQKTDAYMMAKSLLLSENARTSQKPELEIYADDVKCSHGTTTGQLDAEAMNYLLARGIPKPQARALLVKAFAQDLADKIFHDASREQVMSAIDSYLL